MTSSSEQPKEYIITENQLEALAAGCQNEYGEWCKGVDDSFIDTIRSRPHPSPALHKEALHCDCMGCKDEVAEHDAAIARQTREDVLKEKQTLIALFFEKIQSRAYSNNNLPIVYLCDIESELEFVMEHLRTTPQTEQEQPR